MVPIMTGIFSCIIIVLLLEWGLRTYFAHSRQNKYYVHPPKLHKIYRPMLGVVFGAAKMIHFRTNKEGIRGDEFSPEEQYRILTMGGSTTECQFLDQSKTWPCVLQKKLNTPHGWKVWVGNIGKSGLCSREFYMHMKYLLPQYPKIDTIIVLSGVNNFLRPLIEDDRYDPLFWDHYDYWENRLIRGAFSKMPYFKKKFRFHPGYYDETAIGFLVKQFHYKYLQKTLYKDKRKGCDPQARPEKCIENSDALPDLTPSLQEYIRNLHAMIDIAAGKSVRIIFMTQPSLWKKKMTDQEKDLLWSGWAGSKKAGRYYSVEVLMEILEQFNRKLKKVCKARGVECIDLDDILPKDASIFYDDYHFTENGAQLTASIIYKYLVRKEPFTKTQPHRPLVNIHPVDFQLLQDWSKLRRLYVSPV